MASTANRSALLTTVFLDPLEPTRATDPAFRFGGAKRAATIAGAVGFIGLVLMLVGLFTDSHQFFFSYLIGWTVAVGLGLGGLFFVVIHHLVKAKWSIVLRRMAEAMAYTLPALFVLGIPLFVFGMHDVYHWTHHELIDPASPEYDYLIAGKASYLNVPFFLARMVLYFAIWSYMAYRLYSLSVQHDVTGDHLLLNKMRRVASWGLPLLAVSAAFFSYDVLMSLDPHWFSTIFGVYFFSGFYGATFATLVLLASGLQRMGGALDGVVTTEHYQDLGKYMFGFTVFWAYIAFSQYMLIWYGNIPEETVWFRHRLSHGWEYHSAALLIFHFILPFFILITRGAKRVVPVLAIMAVWFLIMHGFDIHWLSQPVLDTLEGNHHAGISAISIASFVGFVGLFFALVLLRLGRHSLVPERDPGLATSIHFQNA